MKGARVTAVAVAATAVLLMIELMVPASAMAFSLNPADWVVDGLKAILNFIFGDVSELGRNIINLLLAVPIITDEGKFPRLHAYREYVMYGAWGLLPLTMFVAFLRYWIAGYSGGGAYEGLIGFARSVAAIGILLVFPVALDQVMRAVNAFTAALIDNPVVGGGLSVGVVKVLDAGSFADGGIAMLITIVAIVSALLLLVVKVVVVALIAVLFVVSPIAIALWPIEELSWAMRGTFQNLAGLMAFPIMWAICFSVFALLSSDALFPGDHGDIINTALSPLIGLASLIVTLVVPYAVLKLAGASAVAPRSSTVVRSVSVVRRVAGRGRV
jgi:hypothetical protein